MKKQDYLRYTDYAFSQEGASYKVNTDTVCLGVFLDAMKGKSVLDIGTNTGALLLYALHKGAISLDGVDIHEDALKIAEENLGRYCDAFRLHHSRIQDFEHGPYDVVICNPPFFEMNNVTDDLYMKEALFEESVPLEELFKAIRRLMKHNGEAYLIYQADRFPELYDMCLRYKLKIMKMRFVHDVHSLHALRVLVKLKVGKMSKLKIYKPLLLDAGKILEDE